MGLGAEHGPGTYEDLVGQVVDYAIIGLDLQGTIQTWNLGAERLKGYTAQQAIGRSFTTFYTEDDQRTGLPADLLSRARAQGRVEHTGWRVRKDGTRFWGDVVITALHDPEGRLTGYAKVTRDLTGQHALEVALRASEERFRVLVGQVVDYAIIALDREGLIETWNLGAERVKGYVAHEAVGQSFSIFYTEEDRGCGLPERLLAQARSKGRVEHTGWRVRKDGALFWADVVITALHDPEGHLTGYAKVTRDRTVMKALEDAQNEFYTTFDHDFRTPITSLKGFIDALRYADQDSRGALIDRVESNADHLLEMVEGLVEVASQRVGPASLKLAETDLAQVARTAVRDLGSSLEPSRIQISEDDVLRAWASGVAMHRVVTNLVVNALKYSPSGTPVTVTFGRARPGWVRLSVIDQGRGIDPEDLDTIFEKFARGRLAEDDGGSGLGLASVRDLVAQQEGVIWVDSVVGTGTTVTVELPCAPANEPADLAQRSTPSAPGRPWCSSPTGQPGG